MSRATAYLLFSSSKGNCCLIRNGADAFLIDAGGTAKRIEDALRAVGQAPEALRAVFLTHEHSDHIKGLDVLCRRYGLPVFAPSGCLSAVAAACPGAAPFLRANDPGTLVELEQTRIYAVRTPHDSLASVGFRMDLSGEKFAYFTDIGHLSGAVLRALSGCERVVIESNHDLSMLKSGPYPASLKRRILGAYGHLSNFDCAALLPHLIGYGTRRIVLAHLSEQNNTPDLAYAESEARLHDALTAGTASLAVAAPDRTVEI